MEDEIRTSWHSISCQFSIFDNQYRSDYDVDCEEIDGDDDYEADYTCPFCSDDFDMVGLCCHIEEEHAIEARTGVCPMCGASVGMDMVEHVVLEHENINRSQTKIKLSRGESQSILSVVRNKLQERNRKSLLKSSSSTVSSLSVSTDEMLRSFICSFPEPVEAEGVAPSSSANACVEKEPSNEFVLERSEANTCEHDEKLEEKAQRCKFVHSLVFSSIVDDGL
ncbi:hypothetical protein Ancab_021822 [Ancistrocladus abbreviatus]